MHPFFTYLLLVNIALVLFYLLYAVVLKRDAILRLQRLFFLSVIVFSLFYPLFTVPVPSDIRLFRPDPGDAVAMVLIEEPAMGVMKGEGLSAWASIPWKETFIFLYLSVTLVFVCRFLFQLLSIYRIWTKSEREIVAGSPVRRLQRDTAPFSFFKLIFIHPEKHSDAELTQILLHEQTHVRQWHSIDAMLIEAVCLFSWWNPFVWLMKREMAMNLEYLADKGVLREGVDSREYQYHLLRLTYDETAVQIVNNFNVSQLKQRIMMMNKPKSPNLTSVKYLLLAPMFFLFITANSIYAGQNENKTETRLSEPPPEKKTVGENDVFEWVEVLPEFPGGFPAMMKYLSANIRYPVEAQQAGIQGRVTCSCVVMKDGSITDVEVLNGRDPLLDAEAVRVINAMPKWNPGTQSGKAVNARYKLPVVFRLQEDAPQNNNNAKAEREEQTQIGSTNEEIVEDEFTPESLAAAKKYAQQAIDHWEKESRKKDDETFEDDETLDDDVIFMVVEKRPEFPGGAEALMKFLSVNIRYPKEAQEAGIQGRVLCDFMVMKDGSITDVKIVSSLDPLLDAEAVRVIKLMPHWIPGEEKGEVANVRYTLPMVFHLGQ